MTPKVATVIQMNKIDKTLFVLRKK